MDLNQVTIIKRKIKYPRLELKTGTPVLILPQNEKIDPMMIIVKHQKWLEQKIEFIENLKKKYKNRKIFQRSEEDLVNIVASSIEKYSTILGGRPAKVRFRYMKTKWGSCSRKRRINFNLKLKYLPPSLVRYIVFHEMTHLIVPNHSESFWFYVKKEFKNPKQYEEMLFGYWFLINSQNYKNPSKMCCLNLFKGESVNLWTKL